MLGRVREALFSTLGQRVTEARVLDLFAGTGSLGLEALSRGASSARFIEQDARVLRVLNANIASLGLEDRAVPVCADGLVSASWSTVDEGYELVFLDPPYPLMRADESRRGVLACLSELFAGVAARAATLVLHVPRGSLGSADFDPTLSARSRTYGTSDLWYVERGEEAL